MLISLILLLVLIAVWCWVIAGIISLDRLHTVRKMILIYLENHEPMSITDLHFCLDTSGIKTKKSTVQTAVDQLLNDRLIENSILLSVPVSYLYQLTKQPARH